MHTLDGQGRLTTVRDSNEGGKPARRRYFIGGSDARIIMGDDEGALLRLWHEKRGEVEPQDLSDHLIVQLGRATEEAESVRGEHPRSSHRGTQPRSRPATYDPLFRLRLRLRNRTPGPPPFSSMNSTPARFRTLAIAASVAASPAYLPVSMFVIVFRWRRAASARSRTVQFSAARAILTCALVTGMVLCHCHMC
jgi:hypothetical protein